MENKITLGDPVFDQMLFVLKHPVTDKNHLDYRFRNEKLRQLAPDVWAMPAYVKANDPYSLFFMFMKLTSGQMVVAFAEGHLNGKAFSFGDPMTTGKGLNQLHAKHPQRANYAAHFLNLISKGAEGDWRMVSK